jgi:tetratricopeptide (TPR) repeat protein
MAYWQGDLADARRWYERAVDACRDLGEPAALADALYNLSFAHSVTRSDPPAARRCAEESLELRRRIGDRDGVARTLFALGNAAYFQDDVVAARNAYAECLSLAAGSGGFLESWGSYMLALAEQGLGSLAEAGHLYRRACGHFAATGDSSGVGMALNALADVAALCGDVPRAARLAAAAERSEASSGATMATFALGQERRGTLRGLRQAAPEDWAAGAALPLEEAVALALSDPDQGRTSSATSA